MHSNFPRDHPIRRIMNLSTISSLQSGSLYSANFSVLASANSSPPAFSKTVQGFLDTFQDLKLDKSRPLLSEVLSGTLRAADSILLRDPPSRTKRILQSGISYARRALDVISIVRQEPSEESDMLVVHAVLSSLGEMILITESLSEFALPFSRAVVAGLNLIRDSKDGHPSATLGADFLLARSLYPLVPYISPGEQSLLITERKQLAALMTRASIISADCAHREWCATFPKELAAFQAVYGYDELSGVWSSKLSQELAALQPVYGYDELSEVIESISPNNILGPHEYASAAWALQPDLETTIDFILATFLFPLNEIDADQEDLTGNQLDAAIDNYDRNARLLRMRERLSEIRDRPNFHIELMVYASLCRYNPEWQKALIDMAVAAHDPHHSNSWDNPRLSHFLYEALDAESNVVDVN